MGMALHMPREKLMGKNVSVCENDRGFVEIEYENVETTNRLSMRMSI